jgi:8-oxo-dGTP pyrophosphatase MutT (NUDIX family)
MKLAAGTLVVNEEGKILSLSKVENGELCVGFPCGKVEEAEFAFDAATRETFEETGYRVALKYGSLEWKPQWESCHPFGQQEENYYTFIYPAIVVSFDPDHKVAEHEGVPAWRDPQELLVGRYGEFNRACLKHFKII